MRLRSCWRGQDNCTGAFVGIGAVTPPTQTYIDAAVMVNQTYCWQVTAKNAVGESGPSNMVRLFLQQAVPPTNLRGTVGN